MSKTQPTISSREVRDSLTLPVSTGTIRRLCDAGTAAKSHCQKEKDAVKRKQSTKEKEKKSTVTKEKRRNILWMKVRSFFIYCQTPPKHKIQATLKAVKHGG